MEMLPPAPVPSNVVVGATVVKRFPGYGERRGTIAEIDLDGGKVVVRWATDESTISLGEAAKQALYAVPPTEEEDGRRRAIGTEAARSPQQKALPRRARRPRRAATYNDSEPDADED